MHNNFHQSFTASHIPSLSHIVKSTSYPQHNMVHRRKFMLMIEMNLFLRQFVNLCNVTILRIYSGGGAGGGGRFSLFEKVYALHLYRFPIIVASRVQQTFI